MMDLMRIAMWQDQTNVPVGKGQQGNSLSGQQLSNERLIVGIVFLLPQVTARQVCTFLRQGDQPSKATRKG